MTDAKPRLLIAYAHPDDESFGLGGLISKYVAQGVDVYLICATDGSAGSMDDEYIQQHGSIRAARLAELDCANEKLGFKHVYMLDYNDSGMMGSESSQHPDSFWSIYNDRPQEVIRRVTEIMREVRPHVVITFNKYGGYGHPDHIAIQRATTEAFDVVNDPAYDTGQAPYQPQKLYYSNIPKFFIQVGIWRTRLQGKNPRQLGRNKDIDIVKIIDHAEPTHTRVDIRDWYDAWDEAGACHKSQGGGSGGFRLIPKSMRRYITPYQGFTRVYPKPARDKIDEYDMFTNVTIDALEPEPTR